VRKESGLARIKKYSLTRMYLEVASLVYDRGR